MRTLARQKLGVQKRASWEVHAFAIRKVRTSAQDYTASPAFKTAPLPAHSHLSFRSRQLRLTRDVRIVRGGVDRDDAVAPAQPGARHGVHLLDPTR